MPPGVDESLLSVVLHSKRIEDWSAFEDVGCGCLQVKNTLEEHLLKGSEDDRFPLMPQRIVADLR
jgi:hypothetical protein